MKIIYNKESDIILIIFKDTKVAESDEIRDGVIIDYDFQGKVCAMEILDASQFIALEGDIIKELTPEVTIN